MKKTIALLAVILLVGGCIKEEKVMLPGDKWNGYDNYLKQGEVLHTLWAGQHIDVGTVTYGIDDNACFYVTYDCSSSGWLISETHMYAGDRAGMPVNKPGSPKIGLFPNAGSHSPWVSSFTYSIPLAELPPADDPGFVVASHCVVHGPSGQCETAWAEGDHIFSDKGWGWYDTYYFNPAQDSSVIIYGTLFTLDTLKIYMIDVTLNTSEQIVVEYVGGVSGRYDASAYSEADNLYFFANYNTGELWINPLGDDSPSFLSGTLTGSPASATFYDQCYYYVDGSLNTINKVEFDSDWMISSITVLSTIPIIATVNDIDVDPSGTVFYIICEEENGVVQLLTWDPVTDSYFSSSMTLDPGAQIAYGSDGNLYSLAVMDDGSSVSAYILETEGSVYTPVSIGVVVVEEPFSDLSRGPSL